MQFATLTLIAFAALISASPNGYQTNSYQTAPSNGYNTAPSNGYNTAPSNGYNTAPPNAYQTSQPAYVAPANNGYNTGHSVQHKHKSWNPIKAIKKAIKKFKKAQKKRRCKDKVTNRNIEMGQKCSQTGSYWYCDKHGHARRVPEAQFQQIAQQEYPQEGYAIQGGQLVEYDNSGAGDAYGQQQPGYNTQPTGY